MNLKDKQRILATIALVVILSIASCTAAPKFPTGRFVDEAANRAFEFDEDGTWRYFEGNMSVPGVSGKYATNGNLYTEMTHDYPDRKVPATYTWTYDGQKLTFHLWGEDVLPHRKGCYDGQTYIKVE